MDNGCNGWSREISRAFRAGSCGIILWTVLSACASVQPPPAYEPGPSTGLDSDRHAVRTPDWARMPLSWNKLAAIETWLQGPNSRRSHYWWNEGQLTLSEGRLEFARNDVDDKGGSKPLRERLWAASQGFALVQKNPRASALQKQRAKHGLLSVEQLKDGPPAQTSSDGLIRRSSWRARAARRNDMTPSGGRFSRITVHHSADSITPQLDGSVGSSASAIRRLQQVHMDGPKTGYGDLGYHYVIDPQGRLFEGRELTWQGAHASGDNNKQNIGVCLLGNFEGSRPSRAAMDTLERTLGDLRGRYSIARNRVYGHQDFKNTLCPGRQLMAWVRSYSGR